MEVSLFWMRLIPSMWTMRTRRWKKFLMPT